MGISHIRGSVNVVDSGTFYTINLSANPTTGDTVCVGVVFETTVSGVSVEDGNFNAYTVTPSSPSPFEDGYVYLFYLLSAPSNASRAISISWTGAANSTGWADEFRTSGGKISFDTDAAAASATGGTTVNTPSITPATTGGLLYATASSAMSVITAPASGATLGGWTGAAGAISNGFMSEYILAAAGTSQAVDFTQSVSSAWSAMAMSFTFTPRELSSLGCGF